MANNRKPKARIEWYGFQGREILLPVCVRSPAMRTKTLIATLEALRDKISTIDLVMCDSLDRYNFNHDGELCHKRGDIWLEAKMPELAKRFTVRSITRWNDVINDSSFHDKHEKLKERYNTSPVIRDTINRIVEYYIQGMRQRLPEGETFDEDAARVNSAHYLIEEFAGTSVYGEWFNLPETYWGVYVENLTVFGNDIKLPMTCPIHLSTLPAPVAGDVVPVMMAA